MTNSNPKGCDLCGDFPVRLLPRCHPLAPLRVVMPSADEVVFYCYVPTCNREVTRLKVVTSSEKNERSP